MSLLKLRRFIHLIVDLFDKVLSAAFSNAILKQESACTASFEHAPLASQSKI